MCAYSWKLPAYICLHLCWELFYLQLDLFYLQLEFLFALSCGSVACSGSVCLARTSKNCKQNNSAVSNTTPPTASKNCPRYIFYVLVCFVSCLFGASDSDYPSSFLFLHVCVICVSYSSSFSASPPFRGLTPPCFLLFSTYVEISTIPSSLLLLVSLILAVVVDVVVLGSCSSSVSSFISSCAPCPAAHLALENENNGQSISLSLPVCLFAKHSFQAVSWNMCSGCMGGALSCFLSVVILLFCFLHNNLLSVQICSCTRIVWVAFLFCLLSPSFYPSAFV